jgi:hypothetical protein
MDMRGWLLVYGETKVNQNSSGARTAGILVVFRKDKMSAAYHRLSPTHPLKSYSSATFLPH